MQATANAQGNCPGAWSWLPPLPSTGEVHPWIAVRHARDANYSVNSGPLFSRITRSGPDGCRWIIEERANKIWIFRNNKDVRYGTDHRDLFPSVDAAREYCAAEDEKSLLS